LGKTPKQVSTDDGFASQANALSARALGVGDVVFGGKLKNKLTQWVKSAFGLDRCTWHSSEEFKSYIWLSVVAWNKLRTPKNQTADTKNIARDRFKNAILEQKLNNGRCFIFWRQAPLQFYLLQLLSRRGCTPLSCSSCIS
jgi:hypothetical protein